MREISYKCFCTFGALRNPRFYSRTIYGWKGTYLCTRYYDSGHGQLTAIP